MKFCYLSILKLWTNLVLHLSKYGFSPFNQILVGLFDILYAYFRIIFELFILFDTFLL